MTPAEVRQIVERVVADHGCGWVYVERHGQAYARKPNTLGMVFVGFGDNVSPNIPESWGDAECARAVALWPEMQRLCQMLREALR